MNSTPRDRLVAVIAAVALHLVVLLSFCYTYLTWPPEDKPDEPEEESEILFINDYINLGDMLTDRRPADAPQAPPGQHAPRQEFPPPPNRQSSPDAQILYPAQIGKAIQIAPLSRRGIR